MGLLLFVSSCASIRSQNDAIQLNQVFRIPGHQQLWMKSARSEKLIEKTIPKLTKAGLYIRNDTLFAEFVPSFLQPTDTNPRTLDRSDSAAVLFVHYKPAANRLEDKSPWFRYQRTTFDVDLLTIPFKYRFRQAGRPEQINTTANVAVYAGIRYDIGNYRATYFRQEQRAELRSFSFGLGGFAGVDATLVNSFSTNGRYTDDYEALGLTYGLAAIIGYKTVTSGLLVGFEQITDPNKVIWIYTRKPWLGISVGININ